MGSWRMQGRERVVVPAMVLVVVLGIAGAWRLGALDGGPGGGPGGAPSGGPGGAEPAVIGDGGDEDRDRVTLAPVSYSPGDCVTWDVEGSGQVDTHVVPCTEEHRMEMTEPVVLQGQDTYPSDEEWGSLNQAQCGPAAARFLGTPLDPYGRFRGDSIVPFEDSWANGDRTMWCGISWAGARDGIGDELFAEEVRGADQQYRYPIGSCVALRTEAPPLIVPCGEGHHMEVVGEIDLSGRSEIPTGAQERGLFDDCAAQARAYLGTDPVAPWLAGKETMTPESWAAGSRRVHCFLGQWDAGDEQIEVTGSAKG